MALESNRHLRALIIHHSTTLSVKRAKAERVDATDFLAGYVASYLIDGSWTEDLRQAKEEVEKMIQVLRLAGEPNPYKEMSDDHISQEIIRELKERKGVLVKV